MRADARARAPDAAKPVLAREGAFDALLRVMQTDSNEVLCFVAVALAALLDSGALAPACLSRACARMRSLRARADDRRQQFVVKGGTSSVMKLLSTTDSKLKGYAAVALCALTESGASCAIVVAAVHALTHRRAQRTRCLAWWRAATSRRSSSCSARPSRR